MASVMVVDIQQTKTTYSDLSQLYDVVVVVVVAAASTAANDYDNDHIKILNVKKNVIFERVI